MLAHGMVHTYELAIPIFIGIWLLEFGATTATLGVIVTVSYGLFGVGALPGGVLADRIGSKRLIVLCLFGMSGSFLVLALAPGLSAVAIALLLWGVAASVYHPAGLTLISKGVKSRGESFAYHGIAGNVGIGFGPLLTAVLLIGLEWRTVAFVLAAPALLAGLLALRIDVDETAAVATTDGGESEHETKGSSGVGSVSEFLSTSTSLFAGSFALVFVLVMFSGLYYRGVLTFLPDLLGDVLAIEPLPIDAYVPFETSGDGAPEIAFERYVYAGLLIVGIFGQYVGGKLTDRIRVERGLLFGWTMLVIAAIAFLPLANAGILTLFLGCILLGFFLFFVQPLYQATVAEYTPPGTRGLSYGFTYLGTFGIGAMGAAIAGFVLDISGAGLLFGVLTTFGVIAASIALYLLYYGR